MRSDYVQRISSELRPRRNTNAKGDIVEVRPTSYAMNGYLRPADFSLAGPTPGFAPTKFFATCGNPQRDRAVRGWEGRGRH